MQFFFNNRKLQFQTSQAEVVKYIIGHAEIEMTVKNKEQVIKAKKFTLLIQRNNQVIYRNTQNTVG